MDLTNITELIRGATPAPTTTAPVAAAPASTDPMGKLQTLLSGMAGGMANMRETVDPYVAFAQGFGGARTYQDTQAAAAAKAAADAQQQQITNQLALTRLGQDQSQFDARMGQDQSQFNAQQDLRTASEKRQQLLADQQMKKTAAEIERLAKSNGVRVTDQLRLEELVLKSAEGIINPQEKKRVMDETRQRLLQQIQQNPSSPDDGPGISSQDLSTAPAPGTVVDGYVFQGGDPNAAESWVAQ